MMEKVHIIVRDEKGLYFVFSKDSGKYKFSACYTYAKPNMSIKELMQVASNWVTDELQPIHTYSGTGIDFTAKYYGTIGIEGGDTEHLVFIQMKEESELIATECPHNYDWASAEMILKGDQYDSVHQTFIIKKLQLLLDDYRELLPYVIVLNKSLDGCTTIMDRESRGTGHNYIGYTGPKR